MGLQTWFRRHSTEHLMRKKMSYLPGAVDLKQAGKNNVDKVDHPKSWKQIMSKKWVPKNWKKQCRTSGFIYAYILSYTSIYLQISFYTSKWLYIPSYATTYIKILNIRKMRANLKQTNGHSSGPRAPPKVQIQPKWSYHVPRYFAIPKEGQN